MCGKESVSVDGNTSLNDRKLTVAMANSAIPYFSEQWKYKEVRPGHTPAGFILKQAQPVQGCDWSRFLKKPCLAWLGCKE